MAFEKTFEIRWSDCDPNRHLRHSAYADLAAHVRLAFLSERGFGPRELEALGFGPVLRREETEYFREVTIGEPLRVDVKLSGLSPDGARWRLTHQLFKQDGERAAVTSVEGGWLNVRTRKLTLPPAELLAVMSSAERSEDFRELPVVRSLAVRPDQEPPGST
jgi:acyl-CoA thioester hydrolase